MLMLSNVTFNCPHQGELFWTSSIHQARLETSFPTLHIPFNYFILAALLATITPAQIDFVQNSTLCFINVSESNKSELKNVNIVPTPEQARFRKDSKYLLNAKLLGTLHSKLLLVIAGKLRQYGTRNQMKVTAMFCPLDC